MENSKLKSQIEAILFLTDKPMKATAIARIVNQDVQLVRQVILELIHDYEERAGGLEVADDDGYILQVRSEYASIIDEFAPLDMSVALLRTLSAVALKQPVAQSEIIKIRGAGAYDHIKDLIERELILKKEDGGRSPMLSTTKQFQEYFRLTQDAKILRNELREERRVDEASAATADGPAEVEQLVLTPAEPVASGEVLAPAAALESAEDSGSAESIVVESSENITIGGTTPEEVALPAEMAEAPAAEVLDFAPDPESSADVAAPAATTVEAEAPLSNEFEPVPAKGTEQSKVSGEHAAISNTTLPTATVDMLDSTIGASGDGAL